LTDCYDEDGNKIPHRARSKILDRPEFGQPPPHLHRKVEVPVMEKRYRHHLDVLREHPGQPAKVYVLKIGSKGVGQWAMTRRKSSVRINYEKTNLQLFLRRYHPLERWKVMVRTTPDTWGDRELWLRYDGTWTEEERAADEQERRQRQKWREDLLVQARAQREAKAKAQIIQMQSQRGKRRQG
jgi:hypothetical protein